MGGKGVPKLSKETLKRVHSKESRQKRLISLRKRPPESKESIHKRTKFLIGKPKNEETRLKISNTLRGRKTPKEVIDKRIIAQTRYIIIAVKENSFIIEYLDSEFIKSNGLKKASLIEIARRETIYSPPKFLLSRNPEYSVLVGYYIYIVMNS